MPNPLRQIAPVLVILAAGSMLATASADETPKPEALAKARLAIARKLYGATEQELIAPPARANETGNMNLPTMERLVTWSTRWMEAERDANPGKAAHIKAVEAHVARLKKWADLYSELAATEQARTADILQFYYLEAEYALAKARTDR